MRSQRVPITTTPERVLFRDAQRGILIIRNRSTTLTDTIYLQFRGPSEADDAFPLDAGESLTLDRGDLSQELWMWGSAANINNRLLVG